MTPYAEVIGDPIAHSKSPLIHNFWLGKLGLEADYRAFHVTAAQLGDYFDARRNDPDWRGCNITMPHKIAALAHVGKHRDPSFPIEPINTAIPRGGKIEGLNTDTVGVFEPLSRLIQSNVGARAAATAESRAAAVVGAGGALFPVMSAVSALGFAPITVVARDPAKLAEVERDYDGLAARGLAMGDPLLPVALLVNASPLGMSGFPAFPYGVETLADDAIVFDMVYSPVETELLRAARDRGLRTIDGLQMLVAQAAAAFECFFGRRAPREHDAELRALLVA